MKRKAPKPESVQLKYDIIPANAPSFAADIVQSAKNISGVELDYSVGSLLKVDEILEDFRKQGCDADEIPETLFGFGCYVGEVFVRHAGFSWRFPTDEEHEAFSMPLIIARGDFPINPIGKVFKRMRNGEADSLAHFYKAASTDE
jgi:hypothetical protein